MKDNYQNRSYSVVEYDPSWPTEFAQQADQLRPIFGPQALTIEHIGSTAVPGLAGKPTIDILITVIGIEPVDALNAQLGQLGYRSLGGYIKPSARLFVQEKDGARLINLHVFQRDDPHVDEMRQLRDYLRQHPDVVDEYSRLKLDLFARYPQDYARYRQHKDAWMEPLKAKIAQLKG